MINRNLAVVLAVVCVSVSANSTSDPFDDLYQSSRLRNAQWANHEQFPYHLAITCLSSNTNELTLCSGALIGTNWILTSASCVFETQTFRIRFGSVNHYTGGIVIESNVAHIHPLFNPEDNSNNVALIRINTRPSANPISIATPAIETSSNALLMTVSGWGVTRFNETSPVLQFAYGRVLANDHPQCIEGQNITAVSPELLCVRVFEQSRVCSGDIGSPLVVQHNRQLYLVGLGSNNPNDSVCDRPITLFTSVSRVTAWIAELTRN